MDPRTTTVLDVERIKRTEVRAELTTCCIVGGGPAGAVLALLLARQGIPVALLEAHADFDRDFRGDTLHPWVLEIMGQLGLAERLLQIPHTRLYEMAIETPTGRFVMSDFRRLKLRYPFIAMMPQPDFLTFITGEAAHYPNFHLLMRARVEGLIEEAGTVRGVRYHSVEGQGELRAALTVAADGRFSRIRKLAGMEPTKIAQPIDVVWFRLPRQLGDPNQPLTRSRRGRILVLINRLDHWQVGCVISKGSYQQLREAGLPVFQSWLAEVVPEIADRVEVLQEWKQLSLLSVEASCLEQWHRPGLLLIGDAAHAMSPIGGFGINMAIMDAVEAANVLARPLKAGQVAASDLAEVQRRRERPTRFIQLYQAARQRRMTRALDSERPLTIPPAMRLLAKVPLIRDLPARISAFGGGRVRVESAI